MEGLKEKQLEQWRSMQKEELLSYDKSKFDFRALIQKMVGHEDLENIHEKYPEYTKAGTITFENDQKTPIHAAFYNSPHLPEFMSTYHAFIKEVIAPMFRLEDEVVFQNKPTFRVHLPNNVAVGAKHRDFDYNHPEGEVNFWLPVTTVSGTSGFFTESEPDKGDFHPIGNLEVGQYYRFYGSKCFHYNAPNDTGKTRISFDFRVIPKSMWVNPSADAASVKSGLKFNIGSYYATCSVSK